MRRAHLLSPGAADQRTGGYLYNARLVSELRALGWQIAVHELEGPWPEGRADGYGGLRGAVGADPVLADGLLWSGLGLPELAPQAMVVVHSLLSVEGGEAWRAREAEALAEVGVVVSTGGPTERGLAAMGVPSVCVVPGVKRVPRSRLPGRGHVVMLGTVTPRKAVCRAVEAVAAVPGASLTVAGSLTRDEAEVARVRARIAGLGVDERVHLVGELGDEGVARLLGDADLLLHTATYEAWGMALAEALARGVPVLSTPAGALEGGGAQVVEAEALPAALARLLADDEARQALADASWARGRALPTWADQARYVGSLLEGLCRSR